MKSVLIFTKGGVITKEPKATENMLKAIEQGVITGTTAKRLKELEAKQKEIEAKILIEQSKSIVRI